MNKLAQKTKASLIHLSAASITAALCYILIKTWYPTPYFEILHGKEILTLAIAIDVTLGPLVTFILFNPAGSKKELFSIVAIATILQVTALSYGLFKAAYSRPLFLAFEGNKFRIVSLPDINNSELSLAPANLQNTSLSGPKIISTKLLEAGDPGLLESIQLDIQGIHPAYRPQRWQNYEKAKNQVLQQAKKIEPDKNFDIKIELLKPSHKNIDDAILTLPIVAYENQSNWAAIIDPISAEVIGFLNYKSLNKIK